MECSRRQLLKSMLYHGPLLTMSGSLVNTASMAAPVWQLGALSPHSTLDLLLPENVAARVVAVSGETVTTQAGESYVWHKSPDGGACFNTETGGWVYVSNSEEFFFRGGTSAIEFDKEGEAKRAYSILELTEGNCAGGATPWGSWLSCEEVDCGYVYETDPLGRFPAIKRRALGRFKHEAVAVDTRRQCMYLTEDEKDGCLYRFTPDQPFPYIESGRLEVACIGDSRGKIRWRTIDDPCPNSFLFQQRTRYQQPTACRFNGGEGIWYQAGMVYFTTKGDNRVWVLDTEVDQLSVLYDGNESTSGILNGVDNVCGSPDGQLVVAEDGGNMQLVLLNHKGETQPLVQVINQSGSEITGPAFSPDGSRLYFSSQRGKDPDERLGITYELRYLG